MCGVCEREDEFVNHAIDTYGSRNEGESGVGWVAEDEVFCVEGCQFLFADTSTGRGLA
jgi:hypothetical protein